MREEIVRFLEKELIGPDPTEPYTQENGEEIILSDPPRMRYSAGILFPQNSTVSLTDSVDKEEEEILTQDLDEEVDSINFELDGKDFSGEISNNDVIEDPTNLANSFLPSAMGFSCYLGNDIKELKIFISAGTYLKVDKYPFTTRSGGKREKVAFVRKAIKNELIINGSDLPDIGSRKSQCKIIQDSKETGLVFDVRNRTTRTDTSIQLYTFTLLNCIHSTGTIRNEDCFFQVEIEVSITDPGKSFSPYIQASQTYLDDEQKSKMLLYRDSKTYAIGHGCSPQWSEHNNIVKKIISKTLPLHEIKPIVPTRLSDVDLDMYTMSDKGNFDDVISSLTTLTEKYRQWVYLQEKTAKNELSGNQLLMSTAKRHIENCIKCCDRMKEGIDILNNERLARHAFQLMNRAMLTQQLRYGLGLRKWTKNSMQAVIIEDHDKQLPDISDKSTWPDWDAQKGTRYGKWRPFQIAFILMNLKSFIDPDSVSRNIVDLIWFPTGGGKTEAYLGLTAYVIFLKRLRNKNDNGTTVLMRYTLRLLTTQQFQRASSLICACDNIRKEYEATLGTERISIGLWVGRESTPNNRQQAVDTYKALDRGETPSTSFVILKCPWCGVQMGVVQVDGEQRIKGYERKRRPADVILKCPNNLCEFSDEDGLPVEVIDETIYEKPVTLLIGTVDKFATLIWKPEARALFGLNDTNRRTPPELIIQDELHLISGPLGSVVGHYEMLINDLCTNNEIRPKIIASTATISRAEEQCHNLYNCGKKNVFLFPPQCLKAGDSFFAKQDDQSDGRMYCGVFANGSPSHITTQIRALASLIQAAKSVEVSEESLRDPYWTIVSYYNSLRELGHTATMIQADIREYLNTIWLRKNYHLLREKTGKDLRRFINNWIELTSRIPSYKIPESLQELEIQYPANDTEHPVDICLATNMISVGVDIPRLGLMVVTGQPKTTSEYIQATSRVGRSKDALGIVFTIYDPSKPRDRSHYEHFQSYHNSIYSQVEPTSITPFSCAVRERCLHAILTGLVRMYGTKDNAEHPQPVPNDSLFNEIRELIEAWVSNVSPEELDLTLILLEEKIQEWKRFAPSVYGNFIYNDDSPPLMYPSGKKPLDSWEHRSWPTPSSMRSVDASCEAEQIGHYPVNEIDED